MLEGTKSYGRETRHIRICLEQREMEERSGKDRQDEDSSFLITQRGSSC